MRHDLDPNVRLLVRSLKVVFRHFSVAQAFELQELVRRTIEVYHAEGMPVRDEALAWALTKEAQEDYDYDYVAEVISAVAAKAVVE